MEKLMSVNTQRRNQVVNVFEKDSTDHSILHSEEKQWEIFVFELKQSLLKKMRMKELLNINQNWHSMEYKNLIHFVIATHSSKMKY